MTIDKSALNLEYDSMHMYSSPGRVLAEAVGLVSICMDLDLDFLSFDPDESMIDQGRVDNQERIKSPRVQRANSSDCTCSCHEACVVGACACTIWIWMDISALEVVGET